MKPARILFVSEPPDTKYYIARAGTTASPQEALWDIVVEIEKPCPKKDWIPCRVNYRE